jgi:hypothetical protein
VRRRERAALVAFGKGMVEMTVGVEKGDIKITPNTQRSL